MIVKEKKHRLPKESYRGEVSVSFTLCLKRSLATPSLQACPVAAGFSLRFNARILTNPEIVAKFTEILTAVVTPSHCIVPVYCFMPDHQHLIITGKNPDSDLWKAVGIYKQKTGFWLSENNSILGWQKDFYDHIIRKNQDVTAQVRYILDNPVRKGLARSWEEYPFKGSIGCTLEDVLLGII